MKSWIIRTSAPDNEFGRYVDDIDHMILNFNRLMQTITRISLPFFSHESLVEIPREYEGKSNNAE